MRFWEENAILGRKRDAKNAKKNHGKHARMQKMRLQSNLPGTQNAKMQNKIRSNIIP